MNKLKVVKFIASAVVGLGTAKIVKDVIKNNVLPESNLDKVTVTVAAWVISAVVSERTKKYTDELIDGAVEFGTEIVGRVKTANSLTRINRGESTFEQEGLDPSLFRKDSDGKYKFIPEEERSATDAAPEVAEKQPANEA